jgi:hypothetical protein
VADAPKLLGTDTLRIAYPKVNMAIDNANAALRNSNDAVATAGQAVETANQALQNSESTQTQLDNIIIENGQSDAEVVQARTKADGTTFPVLRDRLNDVDDKIGILYEQFSPVTTLLNVKNDGTQDISIPLQYYTEGKDDVYLYFPPGVYRWDNNISLTNKKIKLVGNNAIIEHYGSGAILNIGDENTHVTENVYIQGIDFINKKPKPATNGTGVVTIQVRDCVNLTIRDVNIYDAEQYGINLRRTNGSIKNVVLDNVKVFRCSGNLATTTSIALETLASSGDGKIENIKIINSYFEVTDSYINEQGEVTNVSLSNACKLQACDNVELVNVVFSGGKENGPLSFIYDTKKVKMTNVTLKSDSLVSKGLTISDCPNLELYAVNCELGVENFTQSIGVNGSVKKAIFTNCKLQRLTTITGTPQNFEFNNCVFYLPSNSLNISFSDSKFNNCSIDPSSPYKDVIITGDNIKLNNFSGMNILEIWGKGIEIIGGDCESVRPNSNSSNCHIKRLKARYNARAFRCLTDTVSNYLIEECTFIRTVGGGDSSIVNPRGSNMVFINNSIIQEDKTVPVSYAVYFANAVNCIFLEKKNYIDVNIGTAKVGSTGSTGLKQYEIGDTVVNGGVPQIWNGTQFVNI